MSLMTPTKTTRFNGHQTVCLLPHRMPDGDAIGSSIALKELLEALGKEVDLFVEEPLPGHLDFLSEHVRCFEPGLARSRYDLVVALDSSTKDRVADRLDHLVYGRLLAIDHHVTHVPFADETLLVDVASTGEIVQSLFNEAGVAPRGLAAEALYVAMSTDTGSFRYSNTTAETHRRVADLYDLGLDPTHLNAHLYESESLEKVQLRSRVLAKMRLYHGGQMSAAMVTLDEIRDWGIEAPDYDGIVEALRAIAGVEVAFFLRETAPGQFKASLRSKFRVDLTGLATAYGGGGHARAAGFGRPDDGITLYHEVIEAVGELL